MSSLLGRFLRYVQVDTTAREDSGSIPSSPGQLELGRMLAGELAALGVADASQDEHGIVMGTVPATTPGAPVTAWAAHMDTSPEAPGAGVKPVVHERYDGGDIALPGDPTKVIRVAEAGGLAELRGKTLITSDGTTLLGADDKAGVAVIMTAVDRLMADRGIAHGPLRIVFTCDEEAGRGTDKLDVTKVGAVGAYTLDGEGAGLIENETFSADLATVTVKGRNIHPGLATGRMVNAVRLAAEFARRMPWHSMAPETTAGREGFLHPYTVEGGVGETAIKILLRSFDSGELKRQADLLRGIAAQLVAEHPRAEIDVAVVEQYRNMADALTRAPRVVELAAEAVRRAGGTPSFKAIRGGTDGSRMSAMGLPTPNLSAGMHNFHSPLEYACLEEMEQAVNVLVELARLWGGERG
ncbi:MAG: peptidase T [Candidatus Eisenbacteria bacterium]|nr:peptidase T [Candidatus Eisenbacteria bacterium]